MFGLTVGSGPLEFISMGPYTPVSTVFSCPFHLFNLFIFMHLPLGAPISSASLSSYLDNSFFLSISSP